jgi:hypothetical protein
MPVRATDANGFDRFAFLRFTRCGAHGLVELHRGFLAIGQADDIEVGDRPEVAVVAAAADHELVGFDVTVFGRKRGRRDLRVRGVQK